MQTTSKTTIRYWATPILSVLIGIVYLVGFSIGGNLGEGVIGLAVMVAFGAALALLGRRSETVRGLLDHGDERIAGIDLRATALTCLAMIAVVLVGFVVEIARGGSGWPYYMIGAVGGLTYLLAVGYLRLRG
jgi:UDP-N-acetylmuramyl pentapeptide phosphotransferase/UDP-N-acetylglucosamine-1-phosphate transferase